MVALLVSCRCRHRGESLYRRTLVRFAAKIYEALENLSIFEISHCRTFVHSSGTQQTLGDVLLKYSSLDYPLGISSVSCPLLMHCEGYLQLQSLIQAGIPMVNPRHLHFPRHSSGFALCFCQDCGFWVPAVSEGRSLADIPGSGVPKSQGSLLATCQ